MGTGEIKPKTRYQRALSANVEAHRRFAARMPERILKGPLSHDRRF